MILTFCGSFIKKKYISETFMSINQKLNVTKRNKNPSHARV